MNLTLRQQERCTTPLSHKGQYHALFENSPISIWEEDFSDVKKCLDKMRKKGVSDFRNYFNNHPEDVLSLAKKVKIIKVNKATLKLYEARDEKELYRGLHTIFNKQSYSIFREELIALAHGRTIFESEAVNQTLKGEEKHILLKLVVLPGHEDTLSRVYVHIIDISDIKRREAGQKESESKFRRIYETAYDAIFLADAETGIILEVNKKAEELVGLPAYEIVGMHFAEIHPKEEADKYKKLFAHHIKEGECVSDNLVVMSSNGDAIPVSVSSSVLNLKGKKCISATFRRFDKQILKTDGIPMKDQSDHGLTNRECEILKLITSGLSTKQMAGQLSISERTVSTHRTKIMQKLNIHKTAELVRYAMNCGLAE